MLSVIVGVRPCPRASKGLGMVVWLCCSKLYAEAGEWRELVRCGRVRMWARLRSTLPDPESNCKVARACWTNDPSEHTVCNRCSLRRTRAIPCPNKSLNPVQKHAMHHLQMERQTAERCAESGCPFLCPLRHAFMCARQSSKASSDGQER